MKEAVRQVSGEDCEIVGASRTDSGAHAEGQVCHFDNSRPIENRKWKQALNRLLPIDVSVVDAKRVPDWFNSRFCAIHRQYRYRYLLGEKDPFRNRFAYHYWDDLDVNAMRRASEVLVGEHDFRGFTEELDPTVENTRRKVFRLDLKRKGNEIWMDVYGTAFLRGMMRRIAGSLFEVGRGKRPENYPAELLTEKWREMHLPVVLPARGLTLMRITYGRHPRDHRTNSSDNEE